MKYRTKKILLAVGGIGLGAIAASTGGIIIGTAITGILLRSGVLKAAPQASKEGLKLVTSTGQIISSLVTGTACVVSGIKANMSFAGNLVDAIGTIENEDNIKVKVRQDPENPDYVIIDTV